MEAKKMDRRKLRTRRMLREALLELLLEKDYDEMTIKDITDRADLRRATFYLHFDDKDKLLLNTLAETFEVLVKQLEPVMQGKILGGKLELEPYLVMIRHVEANATLYRTIMAGSAATIAIRQLRDFLSQHFANALRDLPPDALMRPVDVLATFVAGGELTLISWWLENNQPYPAEQMAEMVRDTILTGVRGAISAHVLDAIS